MRKRLKIACVSSIVLVAIIAFVIYYNDAFMFQPLYYNDLNMVVEHYSDYDENRDTTTPVSKYNQQLVQEVFEDLSALYNVDKPLPRIAYYHTSNIAQAQYYNGCIYIDFTTNNHDNIKSSIAHELVHYFTDKSTNENGYIGFDYSIDKIYLLGHSLTEGITNFFSNKYAMNNNYEYETHVAKLLAICYGEDSLQDDFFNSKDVSNLRNDFNKGLKKYYSNYVYNFTTYTPFDIMTTSLNSFTQFANTGVRNVHDMLVIEEMFLFYAHYKDCKELVIEEILSFADQHDVKQFNLLLSQQAKLTGR